MAVSVEFLNPRVLNLLNADLRKVAKDFSKRGGLHEPLEQSVRKVIIPSIIENFLSGGRPEPWAPLEPETVMQRSHVGRTAFMANFESFMGGAAPLMRTRKMFNAAKAFARWQIRDNSAKYDFATFPEKAWYAIVHDQKAIADRAGKYGIPTRSFAVLQIPDDAEKIEEVFRIWTEKKINQRLRRVYR